MDTIKLFFSTGFLFFLLNVTPIKAGEIGHHVDEPHWYEKPEILVGIAVFVMPILGVLVNNNLVYQQKQIVNDALDSLKKEMSEERKLYYMSLEKLETTMDDKLNTLLNNQVKFGNQFESSRDELKQVELTISDLKGKVDVLENRVTNIGLYLETRNSDFSTSKRL